MKTPEEIIKYMAYDMPILLANILQLKNMMVIGVCSFTTQKEIT